ncbi:MAG: helix-turn-helix transcriptional regulator [Rhodobacteraceae bacterium]|nr:helix-turn-helix transcriptional regulator [Paracoccaceae bacterium]
MGQSDLQDTGTDATDAGTGRADIAAAPEAGQGGEQDWYAADAATFGDRLTAAREAAGMDRRALSRRLGIRLKTLDAWENDLSEPRANRLQMLAGLLNVSIRWLLTGEGDGLTEPKPDTELAASARETLTDLRQVRAEMGRLSDRIGILEKRLRAIVSEAL